MNIPMWLCWTVVGLLVVFSLILLAGKGSCLIAGYNTSNREKKQKYNEKRLCRVVGAGMGILATIIGIATFYRFELPSSKIFYKCSSKASWIWNKENCYDINRVSE